MENRRFVMSSRARCEFQLVRERLKEEKLILKGLHGLAIFLMHVSLSFCVMGIIIFDTLQVLAYSWEITFRFCCRYSERSI